MNQNTIIYIPKSAIYNIFINKSKGTINDKPIRELCGIIIIWALLIGDKNHLLY